MDTINTHGGSAGRHPKLFNDHVARLMSERGLDDECDKHGVDYKKGNGRRRTWIM